jgi:hypothetical protein
MPECGGVSAANFLGVDLQIRLTRYLHCDLSHQFAIIVHSKTSNFMGKGCKLNAIDCCYATQITQSARIALPRNLWQVFFIVQPVIECSAEFYKTRTLANGWRAATRMPIQSRLTSRHSLCSQPELSRVAICTNSFFRMTVCGRQNRRMIHFSNSCRRRISRRPI